jgi:hypothetical protein
MVRGLIRKVSWMQIGTGLMTNARTLFGLFIADLIVLVMDVKYAWEFIKGQVKFHRVEIYIIVVYTFYLYWLFFSHMLNGEGSVIKGIFTSLSVLGIFLFFTIRSRKDEYFLQGFLVFYCLGRVAMIMAFPDSVENFEYGHNMWRRGIGEAATLGLVALCATSRFKMSLALITGLGLINIFLDFRGMAGVCILAAATYCGLELVRRRNIVAVMAFPAAMVVLLVLFTFLYQYTDALAGDRRGYSNLIRTAMVEDVYTDFLRGDILGNGIDAFKNDFVPPFVDNYGLDQQYRDGLALHGYMLQASYDAGKFGIISFALIYLFAIRALVQCLNYRVNPIYIFILVYGTYCSIMHTFGGFDRYIFALYLFSMSRIMVEADEESREKVSNKANSKLPHAAKQVEPLAPDNLHGTVN